MLSQIARYIKRPKYNDGWGRGTVYRAPLFVRTAVSPTLMLIPSLMILSDVWVIPLLAGPSLLGKVVAGLLLYVSCAACWDVIKWVSVTRLIVSAEGIEYHVFGYRGFAFWHDMECFEHRQKSEGDWTWGIVLSRQGSLTQNRGTILFPFHRSDPNDLNSFIPLSVILSIALRRGRGRRATAALNRFKRTALGQEILHYASHLFENNMRKGKE